MVHSVYTWEPLYLVLVKCNVAAKRGCDIELAVARLVLSLVA